MTQWKPGWTNRPPEQNDLILALAGSGVVKPDNGWLHPRDSALFGDILPGAVSMGTFDGCDVFVTELPESAVGEQQIIPLREALLMMNDAPADMLSTGFQVWQWWCDHQYCGRCGEETGFHPRERARWCAARQVVYGDLTLFEPPAAQYPMGFNPKRDDALQLLIDTCAGGEVYQ